MSEDRHSQADPVELIKDPVEKAKREAENGVRQFKAALEIIRANIQRPDEPQFRLKQQIILSLHQKALDGIHPLAGTYRNSRVFIGNSNHLPPKFLEVPDHVADMCDYVRENWDKNAYHLASYVLWRMNWIHPFADGNGRTARVVSYIVLSIKMDSLLPGTPTIPDQIAADKKPYYAALEEADRAWRIGQIDLTRMTLMIEGMLTKQLLQATQNAGL